MKITIQLAFKNLIGSGLRTWLNVAVLSFVFVIIILFYGLIEGWNKQSEEESIAWDYGYGHLLNEDYDPLDPITFKDGHGELPEEKQKNLTPVLIRQATIYPQGRVQSISLKGIKENQKMVQLPTESFKNSNAEIPAIIGVRTAEATNLKEGNQVLLRWRDNNGTFDAADITISKIFNTNVASVDNGQIWISIDNLWTMTGLEGHATYYIADNAYSNSDVAGWRFEDQDELLSEFRNLIQTKNYSIAFLYGVLLLIALIAVFDTQVLSIFRRQKEIGTYVALGMTRLEVLRLFTLEGVMYSILGIIAGCIYGLPLFLLLQNTGFKLPEYTQGMGANVPSTLYPFYGPGIIIGTAAVLLLSATIVSLIPAWKIAKMDPVLALKGKLQ